MKLMNTKGQVQGLQAFVLGIGGVAIVLAVVLIVLANLQTAALTSTGATTAASNATGAIVTQLAQVPTWIGIIIVVALAMIVLAFFYFKGR